VSRRDGSRLVLGKERVVSLQVPHIQQPTLERARLSPIGEHYGGVYRVSAMSCTPTDEGRTEERPLPILLSLARMGYAVARALICYSSVRPFLMTVKAYADSRVELAGRVHGTTYQC
jgi:hypothetical protein